MQAKFATISLSAGSPDRRTVAKRGSTEADKLTLPLCTSNPSRSFATSRQIGANLCDGSRNRRDASPDRREDQKAVAKRREVVAMLGHFATVQAGEM
jgi:hypothetical protein